MCLTYYDHVWRKEYDIRGEELTLLDNLVYYDRPLIYTASYMSLLWLCCWKDEDQYYLCLITPEMRIDVVENKISYRDAMKSPILYLANFEKERMQAVAWQEELEYFPL